MPRVLAVYAADKNIVDESSARAARHRSHNRLTTQPTTDHKAPPPTPGRGGLFTTPTSSPITSPTCSCQVPGLMEAIKPGGTAMVAPRKYPEELRERSIRMTLEARQDPAARSGACRRIGEQLGINPETLRG